MFQRKLYFFLFFIISATSSTMHSKLTANLQQKEQPTKEIETFLSDEDFYDLDTLDEGSIEDIIKTVEQTTPEEQEISLGKYIKLALAYLKIKSLEMQEQVLMHLKKYHNKYIIASTATFALIATLYVIKMFIEENEKQSSY